MKMILSLAILFISTYLFAQDPFNSSTVLPNANSDMSQAVAFGDYDNDGWIDILLTKGNDADGSGYLNYLFHGSESGLSNLSISPFNSISLTSGTASWADTDNDGDLDIYIANAKPGPFGSSPENNLILNDGDGTFTDVTGNSSFGAIATDEEDSRHVGWGDYNNDGYPDMFIDNAEISIFGPGPGNNSFYSNDGDGSFTKEIETTVGNIAYTGTTLGEYRTFGSGFGWTDFNNDGYLDIFNCSGGGPDANILWKNNSATGKFDDVTPSVLQVDQTSFISASWADYDNDGDMDLFTCNSEDGNVIRNFLFQNNSTSSTVSFADMTSIGTLVTDEHHSFSSTWGDYDNDGDLDVFVSNKDGSSGTSVATLYQNSGSGSFNFSTVKNYGYNSANDFDGRGVASADINNNGFLDLISARDGDPLLFLNSASNSNNFSNVKLVGTGSTNKLALGSRVVIISNIPEQSGITNQLREISGQTGGGSQSDLRTHFGLGTTTKIDEIKAQWLNSTGGSTKQENSYTDLPTNKFMIFTQGDLDVTADITKTQNFMYLFGNTGGSVEFTIADADGGSLTMLKTDSDPGGSFSGNSATNPGSTSITANAVFPDKFWTVTPTDLTEFTTTVYFDASGLTGSPNLDEVVLLKRIGSEATWTALNTSRIGNTLYSTGISSFSDFAIGYQESGVLVETKIFMEGAYDTNLNEMTTTLNSTDIPLTSPYTEDARTVGSVPGDVVDWVLVELRTTPNGATITSKSAFLHKDGRIVSDDGTTGQIELDAPAGSYHIVIKHRNHISIMNSVPLIPLNSSNTTLYDFTTGSDKYYGTDGAKQIDN